MACVLIVPKLFGKLSAVDAASPRVLPLLGILNHQQRLDETGSTVAIVRELCV